MSGDGGNCELRENREERLVSLLYDDGDPAELARTRAHLARCPACREELEKLTETRELLGAWPDVVNAPRIIFVDRPAVAAGGAVAADASTRPRAWVRSLWPSLAAAATVVLLMGATLPFLHFQVGPDGRLRAGLGGSSTSAASPSALVTKADLDQGLTQTAQYLEALVQSGRQQDRQAVLDAVDQALNAESASMQTQVGTAINAAFDEMDRRRRNDLGVMLSSMSDLQAMTGSELRRINAVLASLAPAPNPDQE
jgi:hypothetical protein